MATESPIRIMETSRKWLSHKESAAFRSASANMAVEDLGLLLKSQRFQGNGRDVLPNRSGSAPPSMEGSFAAIENLLSQQRSTSNASLTSLNNANERWKSLHSVHHIGSIGENWRFTSFDDHCNGSLRLPHSNLSTHEEESEDDKSPQRASDDWSDRNIGSGQEAPLGLRKSLVDLIQEEFIRSPPLVYDQSHSSRESVEEAVDYDADSSSLRDPFVSTLNAISSIQSADDMGQSSYSDPPAGSMSCSSSLDGTGGGMPAMPPFSRKYSNNIDVHLGDDVLTSVTSSDATHIESGMKANISSRPGMGNYKNQKDRQNSRQNRMLQQQVYQQQNYTFEVQGSQSPIISQGISHPYTSTNQFLYSPPNFSTAEVQPILQSSGFTPPLYATTSAYMTPPNPFYPNLEPSGYFSPQYGLGGYAFNSTAVPPFVAGYPHPSAIPVAFNGTADPNFSIQTPGVSTGGSATHGVDMLHFNKSYGQLGNAMQPSFIDPLQIQYFQQPFGDAYGVSGQFDRLTLKDGASVAQVSVLDSGKGAEVAAVSAEQKLRQQGTVGHINLNSSRGSTISPYYFGSPTNMGILMQFPTSPMVSPVLPGSPVSGTSFPGGEYEMRFSPGSGRNAGIYSGWQGQRRIEAFNDNKTYSFLEELKSGKGRRFELYDIAGHIVEFSADQHGSRFIQQKLEKCSHEEKASVFNEVLPYVSKLMTDVFGNYVIQKFFEYGSTEQRKELANRLEGQILPLSLQMYGCRVIQKALEVIELEQKTKLVHELDGHVMRCVRDQNGNHVIQKCIESIPTDKIEFIISSFRGQVATLSTHPYGCRVIQRVLERCTDEVQSEFIVNEILESICALAQDQYGNYVTQHVLGRVKPHERTQIISKLSGRIVQLSQHKFASNVLEKCLEYGDSAAREILIGEIIGNGDGNDNLLTMMKDQYANYVVQKILQICADDQREMLLSRIRIHLSALKKYTYGKHIVAQFEQLYGQEVETLGS